MSTQSDTFTVGESVTVKQGVYKNISGVITSLDTDEHGTDVALRVVSDPDGLFSPREMQGLFLHVSPSDL